MKAEPGRDQQQPWSPRNATWSSASFALAAELQAVTIEQLMAKSDFEVGLETLRGGPLGWGTPQPDVRKPPAAASG